MPEERFGQPNGSDLTLLHRVSGMNGSAAAATEVAEPDMRPVSDYLRALRRRSWVVLLLAVIGALAAVAISESQTTKYQASAEVLITHPAGASSLNVQEAARIASTQAELAALPAVASRVLAAAKLRGRTAQDFLNQASAVAAPNADLITLSVTDPNRSLALRLAGLYASQFVAYEQGLQASITRHVQREFTQSLAHGSPLDQAFPRGKRTNGQPSAQQLEALGVPSSDVLAVGTSDQVLRLGRQPTRDGAIGLAAGLVLGLIVAFTLEAFDTRIRSDRRISLRLGVSRLGRLPKPRRRFGLRRARGPVMCQQPASDDADAYRSLCAAIEARNLDVHAQVIAFTGAHAASGSAVTVANVAVALARGGRRVLLVDSDFRRPSLHRLFKLQGTPGLADAALGTVPLEDAIHTIEVHKPGELAMPGARSRAQAPGALEVLSAGSVPADVHVMELLGSAALEGAIGRLRERAELVLLAVPPVDNGEGRAACQRAEALVICARANTVKEPALVDLSEALATVAAPTLGWVTTNARRADCHGAMRFARRRRWLAWRRRSRYA
ncbi:MAG TPA: Wzz/FepE/Etk N-terminal domain-containing protein [Solirubrobacteraceae bacterium]|nr:Wzz/FepE/Etk N-terminal domain-containing protein [Solirubrobacteraceae bacterium]